MVQSGEIETHTIGKRGIRVYLDSVVAFQEQRRIEPIPEIRARRRDIIRQRTASQKHAEESLRKAGILPPLGHAKGARRHDR